MISDHMSITLTKRKNDQFREGSVVLVARTGSSTCPVSLTERFLLVGQHKESDYLFRKIGHTKLGFSFRLQQLTYSRATELFKKQLSHWARPQAIWATLSQVEILRKKFSEPPTGVEPMNFQYRLNALTTEVWETLGEQGHIPGSYMCYMCPVIVQGSTCRNDKCE